METYQDFQQLLLERQNIQAELDHRRNSGQDFSKQLQDMDEISEKINSAYEKIGADDPGDGKKKDPKKLAMATAPLRRQKAMQQVAVDA